MLDTITRETMHNAAMVEVNALTPSKENLVTLCSIRELASLQFSLIEMLDQGPEDNMSLAVYLETLQTKIIKAQVLIAKLMLRGDLTTFVSYNLAMITDVSSACQEIIEVVTGVDVTNAPLPTFH